jgi:molybdate-binding protein/DNA-binding transcriptional regulator YhcF (GntR family)
MDEAYLYRRITETVRQQILSGSLKPGDRLPSVRAMADEWGCTIGTVQRAYQELTRHGLVLSRPGQGTRVVDGLRLKEETPLRTAALVHRAEAFLLEVLTAGFSLSDIEKAVRLAMDRWRAVEEQHAPPEAGTLRFAGSHDLAVAWLASRFPELAPGSSLSLRFCGSLAGLIALAEGEADIAGSHLWDEESDTYNAPFVRRVLPGRRVALVNLAQRRLGLILPAGNPLGLGGLADLTRPGLRLANRQAGSGTRVWLDAALRKAGIPVGRIPGYAEEEELTHSAVAQAVAEGRAQVGIGLEAAARTFGLDFILLTRDHYDLVIPEEGMANPLAGRLLDWLALAETRRAIERFGGYDTSHTGQVAWVG